MLMRIIYLILTVLIIGLSNSSCIFSEFFGGKKDFVADTVVAVQNLKQIEVQYVDSDSSYSVISYWTDNNGRPLYMKSRINFVRQIKNGPEKHWTSNGQLIYSALWSNGSPIGSLMEYYENGVLKRRVDYDDSKAYPRFEMNFYENGRPKTDTIVYYKGKKDGAVNYYHPETGEIFETFIYSKDTLIDVKIYKAEYENLNRQAEALARSVKRDSAERERKDALFATLLGNLKSSSGNNWTNGENLKEKIDYLESMLKEEKK
jgi:antitoxin component YwqK of YwqJK toxin-antitoxin module